MMLELHDLSLEIAGNMRLDKKNTNAESPC